MVPFLQRLAEALLERHPHDLEDVAVVLPGKRAGLHLRKYLAEAHGGALWSPDIMDVGNFVQRVSGLQQGNSMELLFHLHSTYMELRGDAADPLETFLEWAPTTLRDLSEVDAHLLDLDTLYKDLRAYHELDEWSFNLGELSPGQQRTNAEWRATGELHRLFHERMRATGLATSGFVARISAEITSQSIALPWKKIWFAGLNALDPATTSTIKNLQDQGRAEVAWDTDTHYLADQRQEAGRYLRRSIKDLGEGVLPPQSGIATTERRIRLVETPHPLAQAAYAAQRLSEMSAEERSKTAVVLAQEDLLLPLLQRMPAHIGPVNVTMGIPLTTLPVHGLTECFFEVLDQTTPTTCSVHALIALFAHPFLRENGPTERILDALRGQARLHIEHDELRALITDANSTFLPVVPFMLHVAEHQAMTGNALTNLLDHAHNTAPDDPLVREQLFLMARVQQRLNRLLDRSGIPAPSLRAYRTIRERVLREERLAFLGEPLKGTQVMGLLETRTVDHERLIFIGVNEGTLPRSEAPTSWIPYDLRRHHGLPLPSDAEAVTAYNFQRAMQLANHVEWTVSTGDGKEPGEPSRFIAQWQHEVIGQTRTTLETARVSPRSTARGVPPIHVEKDEHIQQRLRQLCAKGLSPSALGTWLRCPLDFYFRYIVGVRDKDVVDGRLGSDVLGDAVHNALQHLFTPMVGHVLEPQRITEASTHALRSLEDQLAQHLPRTALEFGHYRLRKEMAGKALETYLKAESQRCSSQPTRIEAIELEVKATLSNGVLLKGRCDRIDTREGRITVLDVKTGAVREIELRLPDLERDTVTADRRYALQLLIYLWAYLRENQHVEQASAGVIPLQRPSNAAGDRLRVGGEEVITRQQLPVIEALLVQLTNELLDPNIPFTHDPNSDYCRCCVN